MATYKKRGAKKSVAKTNTPAEEIKSTTAEVFESLDQTASRSEAFVSQYQNYILIAVSVVVVGALSYLAYDNFIAQPKAAEAVNELNQAQYYFELAVNNSTESDSLFRLALEGGEGKYGFLDIIDNYSGTPAAKLATYSAGMAYLNLKEFENAISFLDNFSSDDVMLSALSQGAIGDAFAQLEQPEEAFEYYIKAANASTNAFSTPKYLFKAGLIGAQIGKEDQALSFYKRIKEEFPQAPEAARVEVQIGKLEHSSN
ncbi:MAG: tetratricopeptide repeat protein [Flavobacteriaceae bacterium]